MPSTSGPDPLKLLAWVSFIALLLIFTRSIHSSSPAPYAQPADNSIRDIIVRSIHDGDTVTADVCFGSLGRTEFWAHNIRLRLKGVRAYELPDDPKGQDPQERETAVIEREALAHAVLDTAAQPIRARLYRQTYDRYEAVLYSATQNINELMLTYPQGGR